MYVAPQSDQEWLLNEQRKLYARSFENPEFTHRKLWGLVTDRRNLRCSLSRVARNKGARTAGVDGVTVRMILRGGVETFVEGLREELRSREYRPSPARRKDIPKPGKPGETRPLGIPTAKDKVVQAAVKHIMEPIFEADFYPSSFGFRPGRSVHGALEQIRKLLNSPVLSKSPKDEPRLTYQWVIEGDIKGCFDNISHHGLMNRIRHRIGDNRLNRLVVKMLKAGVMSEEQFLQTEVGTPQGGILSPLLANIALSVIDERYERHVWPRSRPTPLHDEAAIKKRVTYNRSNDRIAGRPVLVPVRYADDFVIFVCAPKGPNQKERAQQIAHQEKAALAALLKESLNLELSEAKTFITPVTKSIQFLGFHFRVQRHPVYGWTSKIVIPKDRSRKLRRSIKVVFNRRLNNRSLENRLKELNPIIRGWAYFYRYATGAKHVFSEIDNFVWHTVFRWLRKKHPRTGLGKLYKRYGSRKPGRRSIKWQGNTVKPFELSSLRVSRYRSYWDTRPSFVSTPMESPVRNERRTPGLEKGAPESR
jgi:group II intron reverse transcriptase/maturase